MIRNCLEVKLNIQPVCFGLVHRYYYEGPCRFAKGDALTCEYDCIASQTVFDAFKQDCAEQMPEFVNLLEPLYFECHDDWVMPEAMFEEMTKNVGEVDAYLINTGIAREIPVIELAERTRKPILFDPNISFAITGLNAPIRSRGLEAYAECTWSGLAKRMRVLWVRKALQKANILVGVRYNSNTSKALNDSFTSLADVTRVFGTHFRYMNMHEILDCMEPLTDKGNYTTPGRLDTPNLTQEEIKEAEKLADELLSGADDVHISREDMITSCKAHVLVKKLLDLHDCCGFSIPCPDLCSTTRINDMKFTFCLNHSLLTEMGIPSTCDFDINSLMAMIILTMMTENAPFLGNAGPIIVENEQIRPYPRLRIELDPEEDIHNLYRTDHSTHIRKLHGIKGDTSRYGVRHFALDQKFGAVLRYRFAEDKGQVITMCRFSPDCKKMLIGKGTIVGGGGYEDNNCNGFVIYRVADQKKFYQAHAYVGNHIPLVYGDCVEELVMLAEALGLEPMVV